jgi:hypothetical protein
VKEWWRHTHYCTSALRKWLMLDEREKNDGKEKRVSVKWIKHYFKN